MAVTRVVHAWSSPTGRDGGAAALASPDCALRHLDLPARAGVRNGRAFGRAPLLVHGASFRVHSASFRVHGASFRVHGASFRVHGASFLGAAGVAALMGALRDPACALESLFLWGQPRPRARARRGGGDGGAGGRRSARGDGPAAL